MDKFANSYEKRKEKLKETYHERKVQDPEHWAFLQQKGRETYERTKARKVGLLEPRGRGRPKKSDVAPEKRDPEILGEEEAEEEMKSLPPPPSARQISMQRSKDIPVRRNRLVRTPTPPPIEDEYEVSDRQAMPTKGYERINNLF